MRDWGYGEAGIDETPHLVCLAGCADAVPFRLGARMSDPPVTEVDYVVVGAGSAGCVVASRLAEDPDVTVWLAEAGPRADFLLSIPGALLRSSTAPKFNWNIATEPEAALDDRSLFWSQGRVLGGSSAINGMVYTRGAPGDFDEWAALGCPGWTFADVLPFFRKSETNERGASHWHGGSGPMAVTRGDPRIGILDRLLAAAADRGHRMVDDFNAGDPTGFGHYDRTIGGGRRSSTAQAFLRRPGNGRNLRWSTGVLVERILIENGIAAGVACMRNGKRWIVRAAREVILCAGALKSPQLLMLSGIGPADQLRAHGLPVTADVPAIGEGLGTHMLFPLSFACSEPITAYAHATVGGAARAVLRYSAGRGGILGQTPIASGGFLKTDDALDRPDIQVQAMIGLAGQVGQSLWSRLPKRHGFALMVNQARPVSRGSVSLRSADPRQPPIVRAGLLSAPGDVDVVVAGVERVQDILSSAAIAGVITPLPERLPSDRAALAAVVRARSYLAFHGTGTCRMGSGADAVVDPELRMHSITRLRVADASVIPTMLGANMNAPAIMVGERCADFISAPPTVGGN